MEAGHGHSRLQGERHAGRPHLPFIGMWRDAIERKVWLPEKHSACVRAPSVPTGPSPLLVESPRCFHRLMAGSAKSSEKSTVQEVVRAATRAPSPHNSQPWRFTAHTAASGETVVDVWADYERGLRVADREGRELSISCGAALEFGRIAGRALGRAAAVTLQPDPSESELLGRIVLGAEQPASERDLRWAAAIPSRHTVRDRFEERPVSQEDLDALRASVDLSETWVRFVRSPDDEIVLAVLLARADEAEASDADYADEVARWRRRDESQGDGMSPLAIGSTPVAERASSLKLRDFRIGTAPSAARSNDRPPPPEHPVVLILGTMSDDPLAWLIAGQALGRLLLEATCRGIGASPMTQVLEVTPYRTMLTNALNLVGPPQMVLRLGYGVAQAASNRRPVSEVLTTDL